MSAFRRGKEHSSCEISTSTHGERESRPGDQSKSEICTQRADKTSDHSHSQIHCAEGLIHRNVPADYDVLVGGYGNVGQFSRRDWKIYLVSCNTPQRCGSRPRPQVANKDSLVARSHFGATVLGSPPSCIMREIRQIGKGRDPCTLFLA